MFSNEIISYNLSTTTNLNQISDMLVKAIEKFDSFNGLILYLDQG